jgi:hypothetical protein
MQYEKSSRATNMIYTQMFIALLLDQLVFGHSPELLSMIGSAMILGSAIYVALIQNSQKKLDQDRPGTTQDEETGLMQEIDGDEHDIELPERHPKTTVSK